MILIFSERNDLSTRNVISYLNYFESNFNLFLEDDLIEFHYSIDDTGFNFNVFKNKEFLCASIEIKSVWYRRTDIRVNQLGNGNIEEPDGQDYSKAHVQTRYEQIQRSLHNKKCLGVFGKGNFNKIEFLEQCVLLGIDVPKTLITNSKNELISFMNECEGKVITKSLANPYRYVNEQDANVLKAKLGYTAKIDSEILSEIPEIFDLSLFQEQLEKKYELRVFYINGKCFTEIIFSQNNLESSVDYRQGYDTTMRCCNFSLPSSLQDQIQGLMKKISLNTGSLDIVVTKENKFVFLEVNPSGQFGAVSELTNSNLEFEIASFLLN